MKISPFCLVVWMSSATVSSGETLHEAIINDFMPESSPMCVPTEGTTSHTYVFESSQEESKWFEGYPESIEYGAPWSNLEQYVFSAKMTHTDPNNDDRDWTIRLGGGGNIYSFYTKAGEIIAPQKRVESPWIDDVWHSVGVDVSKNRDGNTDNYMIHGAGSYQSDDYSSNRGIPLKQVPFYAQDLGKYCKDEEGECGFVSWAQHGPVPVTWESPLINFNRYKDCGNGVFEHTALHHNDNNGSGHYINRFDAPFGSIRDSTLTDMVMTDKASNSEVLYEQSDLGRYDTDPIKIKLKDTLGYSMFGEDLPAPKGGEPFPVPSGIQYKIGYNGCRLTTNNYPHTAVMCKIEPTGKDRSASRASLRFRGTPSSVSTFVPPCVGSNCLSTLKFLKYGATNSFCRKYPYPDGGEISCRLDYVHVNEFVLHSGDRGFVQFKTDAGRVFTATDGIVYWSLTHAPNAKVWHMVFKPRPGVDADLAEIESLIAAAPFDEWVISYFNPPGSGGDVIARRGVIHWSEYYDRYDTYWLFFYPDPVDGVDDADMGEYVRTKFPPGSTLEVLYDPGKPLEDNLGFGHVHGNDFSNSDGVSDGWPIVILGQAQEGARPRDANFYNIVTTANLQTEGSTHYYRQYFVVDRFPEISSTAASFVAEVDHQNYHIENGPSGRVVDLYADFDSGTVGATVGGRKCGGNPSTPAPSGSPSASPTTGSPTKSSESPTASPTTGSPTKSSAPPTASPTTGSPTTGSTSASPTGPPTEFPYPKDKRGKTVILKSSGNVIISAETYKKEKCTLRIMLKSKLTRQILGPTYKSVSLLFYTADGKRTSDPPFDLTTLKYWYKKQKFMQVVPAPPYNTVDMCQEAECLLEKRFKRDYYLNVTYTSDLDDTVDMEEGSTTAATPPSKICSGSTTPKSNMRALYHVTCGSETYIGHDPYNFSPNDWTGQGKLRPYICLNDKTARGKWKLLGFFPDGACADLTDGFTYEEELCSAD